MFSLNVKIACHQRFARRTRCGLATEIFPLAQNENSKKSEQLTENLAMKFCALLVVRQNFFRIIIYNNLFKTTFQKQSSSKVAKNLDWKSQNFRVCPKPKLLATNGLTLPEVAVWQPSFLHYRKRK